MSHHFKEKSMNRNHQNRNSLNHTNRGRQNLARKQLGPGMRTPMHSNPNEERNIRYSTASFWSEKNYPYEYQNINQNDFYAPDSSQSPGFWEDPTPVRVEAKDSLRHSHDFVESYDHHGREFSYRAKSQIDMLGEEDVIHSYQGLGPKDYKRSDSFIEEEVCEKLAHDIYIDASDITVSVQDGIVRVFGTVSNRKQKFNIEDLIEEVRGVVEVQNDIKIQKYFISTPSER